MSKNTPPHHHRTSHNSFGLSLWGDYLLSINLVGSVVIIVTAILSLARKYCFFKSCLFGIKRFTVLSRIILSSATILLVNGSAALTGELKPSLSEYYCISTNSDSLRYIFHIPFILLALVTVCSIWMPPYLFSCGGI